MPTLVHVLLTVVLTLFLAVQARSLVLVLRSRRVVAAGRAPGRADLFWACIPVVVVLFLAARSWVAVLELPAPAVAAVGALSEAAGLPPTPKGPDPTP